MLPVIFVVAVQVIYITHLSYSTHKLSNGQPKKKAKKTKPYMFREAKNKNKNEFVDTMIDI